ncbi:hypothetical protein WJX81_000166 [Elliptochloris bilobata]|uniref:1-phosphatidylinositol 4-kinase n=1 Tax=Elliptochloris bilobata TaxID=381761 RepID=A0AAW1S598_9CHLO
MTQAEAADLVHAGTVLARLGRALGGLPRAEAQALSEAGSLWRAAAAAPGPPLPLLPADAAALLSSLVGASCGTADLALAQRLVQTVRDRGEQLPLAARQMMLDLACRELRDALQPLRAASNGKNPAPPHQGGPPALPPRERVTAAARLAVALVAAQPTNNSIEAAALNAEANGGPAKSDRGELAAAAAGALLEAGETALAAGALLDPGGPGAAEVLGLAATALAPLPAALAATGTAEAPAASVLLVRARALVGSAARLAASGPSRPTWRWPPTESLCANIPPATFAPLADLALPASDPQYERELQAGLLMLARLATLLEGDGEVAQRVLPLLAGANAAAAPPGVRATAAFVLACIAGACACGGCRWGYEQGAAALVALCRGKGDGGAGTPLLADDRGDLAAALEQLAELLEQAPANIRSDLHASLLALFTDAAMGVRGGDARGMRALGALLPALAAAGAGLTQARPHALGGASAVDIGELQALQERSAGLVKMHRLTWLYIALHDFGALAPLAQHAGPADQPPAWRAAVGRLAADAPPIVAAGGGEEDLAKLDADLGERLRRFGPQAAQGALTARLVALTAPPPHRRRGATLAQVSPAASAHLLSVAALHRARALAAPLDGTSGLPPLAPLLAALEMAAPGSWSAPWLSAIAEATFACYCCRFELAGPGALGESDTHRAAAEEALAGSLVAHLDAGSGGGAPTTRALAAELLNALLARCSGLLWWPELFRALLDAVQAAEAGATGSSAQPPNSLHWLLQVVARGAAAAPGVTEALLQQALTGQPGHPAAGRHAAELLAAADSGRARSPMAALPGPPSGALALNRKARASGVVAGMAMAAKASQRAPAGVAEQAARSLQAALDARSPAAVLHDRYLQAAAALVLSGSVRGPGAPLLRLLARAPARDPDPDMARVAAFAWHWVNAGVPGCQAALVAEVTEAWLAMAEAGDGLFDGRYDPEGVAAAGPGTDPDADGLTRRIAAHHAWLAFLGEAWQAWAEGGGAEAAAVRALLGRALARSLQVPRGLSRHPAAAGPVFRLLGLALRCARHGMAEASGLPGGAGPPLATTLLAERILAAALAWFAGPAAWYGRWSDGEAREAAAAVAEFERAVERVPEWPASAPGPTPGGNAARAALLLLLLRTEAQRLAVWTAPLEAAPATAAGGGAGVSAAEWRQHMRTAWGVDPRLALALLDRLPGAAAARGEAEALATAHAGEPDVQALPKAAALLATPAAARAGVGAALAHLATWAPAPLLQALEMMSGPAARVPAVRAYALRSLHACNPQQVAFFLPQLVQLLRADDGGAVEAFLREEARRARLFAHLLLCALRTEGTPPDEAFAPAVKRSGWQRPEDTGIWGAADCVAKKVWAEAAPAEAEFLRAELDFFGAVTGVSGALYPVPKDHRRVAAAELVRKIPLLRDDLYLPTNPRSRVLAAIPESATPMQSAAKVPILVAFQIDEDGQSTGSEGTSRVQALIFKVGDDCRQDVLALQVVALLRDALAAAGLGLYLAPYGVLPTDYECGIIEVVPDTKSRSALGETADGGLAEIFRRKFGEPGSRRFETARDNFIASEAGYAVACFLLQAKDRHNGNILLDGRGRLVHIDFGFILEISPGGNMRFESAAFKLSHEMTQLLDPGGSRASAPFRRFQELCIRGYLAARGVAGGIIATVALMAESGLPCYGRGAPVDNLRRRFRLDFTDAQAAEFMRSTIADAYDKWTTGFYDYVQYLQNSIPK